MSVEHRETLGESARWGRWLARRRSGSKTRRWESLSTGAVLGARVGGGSQ